MIDLYMRLHPSSEHTRERGLSAHPWSFLPSHWTFPILLGLS